MTNLSDLAPRVRAFHDSAASVASRYDSLHGQGIESEDIDELRQIIADLRAIVEEIRPMAATRVEMQTMIDEAREVIDDLDVALLKGDEMPDVDDVMEFVAMLEEWISDNQEEDDGLETLSARVARRRRQRREADIAADDDAAADEATSGGDAAAEVFAPEALETVDEVDAEIARYEEAIAGLQADITAYETALDMLADRRAEIEAGGATAADVETPPPANAAPLPAPSSDQQAA